MAGDLRHDDDRAFRAELASWAAPEELLNGLRTYQGRHSGQDAAAAGPSSVGMPMAVRDDIRTFAVEHLGQADAMPSLPNHG